VPVNTNVLGIGARVQAAATTDGRSRGGTPRKGTPLRLAVLATIIEKPGWRYDISTRFNRRFGASLRKSDRRIYQVVEALLADGLIEVVQHAPLLHYAATELGREAHRVWLSQALTDDTERTASQVGILAASLTDQQSALALLDEYERLVIAEMAELRPLTTSVQAELLVRMHRMVGEAQLRWVEYARQRLSAEQ